MILGFLASIVLSFLPSRYRRGWRHTESEEMGTATAVSGGMQGFIFLLFFVVGFLDYLPEVGISKLGWLEYIFTPRGVVLGYFALEGVARFVIGLASGEAVGTLPLHLLAWVQERRERKHAERALGPLVADTVDRGDGRAYDLRIASCRPKPNWDRLMTVAYEDTFYEVAGERQGNPPRRFVYLLRKMPQGKVIRGLHHYRPDEALDKETKPSMNPSG